MNNWNNVAILSLGALLLCATATAQLDFGNLKLGKKKEKTGVERTENSNATMAAVSLEFDYKKNQADYAQLFLASNGKIFQLEYNTSQDKYIPTGKSANKYDIFKQGIKSDESYQQVNTSAPVMLIDHVGMENYFTNYDLGPSAWVSWSDKKRIVENHGEGKKYRDQQALDYAGYVFFDGIAFYCNYNRYDDGLKYVIRSAPRFLWVTDKSIAKSLNGQLIIDRAVEYLVKGENESDGFIKGLSLKLAAEDRARNSIDGKAVKSLTVKLADGATKLGLNEEKEFVIEATLEDGTVMSTLKKAYKDDYEITAPAAKGLGLASCMLSPYNSEGSGTFALANVKDVIEVTIKSKYHPNLQPVTLKVPVDHSKRVTMDYSGSPFGRLAGIAAVVEVKKVKHADGSPLLEYRMRYRDETNWYQVVRVKPETEVFFISNGATKTGRSDKNGHDGGVGGDVRLIVDPSVTSYNFKTSLKGAAGQDTKSAVYIKGAAGKDGKLTVEKKSVAW